LAESIQSGGAAEAAGLGDVPEKLETNVVHGDNSISVKLILQARTFC
jgi:hypothetical protein